MRKSPLVFFLAINIFLTTQILAKTKDHTTENASVQPVFQRSTERKPSFWTRTANLLKTSTYLRSHKPSANRTLLHSKYFISKNEMPESSPKPVTPGTPEQRPCRKGVKSLPEILNKKIFPKKKENEDIEDKIMKDESFNRLKEFAKSFINKTTAYFLKKKKSQSRSYPIEEPHSQHQLWDGKDQTYHASTFTNVEYEPNSFHHHYLPPPPIHYLPPQKKDDTLLAKVALIALLKLILAKLKAIGFLKLMTFFLMKIPVIFLKFLFILKTLKLLSLVSIPFLITLVALPFLPLISFFAPLLFFPILFLPLLLPLILPFLFFLPIVPVTTPVTAAASTRIKRNASDSNSENSSKWSLIDEKWKNYQINQTENRARYFRTRGRPVTFENKNLENKLSSNNTPNIFYKLDQSETQTNSNLIELTQKVLESQQCIERIACELAIQNDSKIYQEAVIWALGKVLTLAPERIKQKIEKYKQAYETSTKKKSSDFCQQQFKCQRPKIYIMQGKAKYNVF